MPMLSMLCATNARAKYGLTDEELFKYLKYTPAQNPYRRDGPCMRLYYVAELEALVVRLRVMREEAQAAAAARASARAAERAATALRKRQEATALCADMATQASQASQASKASKTVTGSAEGPLTLDAWADVLSHLGARAYEPHGLVGACVAARWLCTAAAVCRDLRVAARGAIADLGAAVAAKDVGALRSLLTPAESAEGVTVDDPLERVLRRPTACTLVQLRGVAKGIGVTMGGLKAELVARLVRELRLGDRPLPEHVPIRLVLRTYLERARWTREEGALTRPLDGSLVKAYEGFRCAGACPEVTPEATKAMREGSCQSLADLQAALCRAFPVEGPGDTHDQAFLRAWREHEAYKARAAQLENEARRDRLLQSPHCVKCKEFNRATVCQYAMCARCCPGCKRHDNRRGFRFRF
jgi:hypothetical protein